MKLLICTQVVDKNDPVLGFFHRWIEEFAQHCETVEVICLRKGEDSLPPNVHVHEIGRGNKVTRAVRLMYVVWKLRGAYNRVFVHMNPEYLIVAGWYWRLRGIKIVLWYMHKAVNMRLRIAEWYADDILTASKESFRLPSKKVHVVGHGIDTKFFSPDPHIQREGWWLSVGRLSKSKRHDKAIEMAQEAGKELRIAGDGPEGAELMRFANSHNAHVRFLGGLTQAQLRDVYRRAALFIHTSETGSLDKVVLEALACGLPIKTTAPELKYLEKETPEYVKKNHSLPVLISTIVTHLS